MWTRVLNRPLSASKITILLCSLQFRVEYLMMELKVQSCTNKKVPTREGTNTRLPRIAPVSQQAHWVLTTCAKWSGFPAKISCLWCTYIERIKICIFLQALNSSKRHLCAPLPSITGHAFGVQFRFEQNARILAQNKTANIPSHNDLKNACVSLQLSSMPTLLLVLYMKGEVDISVAPSVYFSKVHKEAFTTCAIIACFERRRKKTCNTSASKSLSWQE